MNHVLSLLLKDLRRDAKHPWSIVLFAALPLLMTALMAAVFGGEAKQEMPVIRLAILDQDKDLIGGVLQSMPSQGDLANRLRLLFVTNRDEGVRILEDRQASAFLVLPTNLTENLLGGRTNTLDLYENPAEQILPKIVRQGTSLLAVGLSSAADLLNGPLQQARSLFQADRFPAEAAVAGAASDTVRDLGRVRGYVFPPLIQFDNVAAEALSPPDPGPRPAASTP